MLSTFGDEVGFRAGELGEIDRRLREVERRLDELEGSPLSGAARADLSRLSETERRIVSLVAVGRTNDEVGERLFLSPKTVEWSLTKIYRKLRVRSRTELAAKLAAGAVRSDTSGETPGKDLAPSETATQDESRGGSPSTGSSQIDDMEGT